MRLNDAKIGYSGYSVDNGVAGDRRRFIAWANQRGIAFEQAQLDSDYDVVYLTHNSDLSGWLHRKQLGGTRARFIFELVDSYFTQSHPVLRRVKGLARRALGVESRLSPDFLRTLERVSAASEAVLCSTEEQAAAIRCFNDNVFISFDYFGDELPIPKQDYRREGRLRLGWEGQAVTLSNINTIAPVLNALSDRIELHVVTDPIIRKYMGRFGTRHSMEILAPVTAPKVFHPWRQETFAGHLKACDVLIIPIDMASTVMRGKPENKLILLWKLGLPVIVSNTPAYSRTMEVAGLNMVCESLDDWRAALERIAVMGADDLAVLTNMGRSYAEIAYSDELFRAPFDRAFVAAGLTL